MEIRNVVDVIRACAETNSRKEKVMILRNYDSRELRYFLELSVSPYIVFNIKQFEFAEPLMQDDFDTNLSQLKFCVHHLRMRDVKPVGEFVTECSKHLNKDQQWMLQCILEKDFRAGLGLKTVNEAFPGLIPDFSVQLCRKIDMGKVVYPCLAEIKRDGRRNIAVVTAGIVTHYSRNGKENKNYHCFDSELLAISNGVDCVFDGEVSGIGGKDNREERRISAKQASRKYNVDMSNQIYTIWDHMPLGSWKLKRCNIKLAQRYNRLKVAVDEFRDKTIIENFGVRLSKVRIKENEEDLLKFYRKAIGSGYEGVVVKDPESPYTFKRGTEWMKLKPTETCDVPIVDVLEGKKSRKGTLGSIVVELDGVRIRCGLGRGITIDKCKELWGQREELIGKIAEIQHGGKTLDGSLSVGKFVKIRSDK